MPEAGDDAVRVVGVGCSAGGLGALSELLGGLGAEPDVCLVVLHHTDPSQETNLVSLLAGETPLAVRTLEEGDRPEADTVLTAPPGHAIALEDGAFRLERVDRTRERDAVDRFLGSLADELGSRAVGVVLSGTLDDGTRGLGAIQGAGGLAFAQAIDTAESAGMPRSAIASGHVDVVLPSREIGERIARLSARGASPGRDPSSEAGEDTLDAIFELVHERTGVDFANYKTSTLARRIDRRRVARGVDTLDEYLDVLREDPQEAQALHDESLIHVTGFFRDPATFEALAETVFPRLEHVAVEDPPVRVWVPACATGEEAYSLAIALHEHLEAAGVEPRIQVFGSDLSEATVEVAREARYPEGIRDEVSPDRLRRFFDEEDEGYRVRPELREACIFARHDLLRDAPFSDVDLVSCRNVLLYLEPSEQLRVAASLHYALSAGGTLAIGADESLERFDDWFDRLDPDHSLYEKQPVSPSPYLTRFRASQPQDAGPSVPQATGPGKPASPSGLESELGPEVDRVLLDAFAPPAVVLDESLRVLEFRGDVGRYLSPSEGEASLELSSVVPSGLGLAVRSLVDEVREEGRARGRSGVRVDLLAGEETVAVRVLPVPSGDGGDPQAYVATFRREEGGPKPSPAAALLGTAVDAVREVLGSGETERERELREDLEATRTSLETTTDEYEDTTERLREANEEALSANEELQSTNEELATAKEELQSANEELNTLNEELRERNEALQDVNDDLRNVLDSVDLPILILGPDLRIRRFNDAAREVFGFVDADLGRPLSELKHPFEPEVLEGAVLDVLDSLEPERRPLSSADGDGHRLQVHPYQTREDRVDGAVLVLWPDDEARSP